MNESNTHQLILQYIYGETNAEMELKVRGILESSPEIANYYLEMKEVKNSLDSILEDPHPTSVAIISEHSHDSHTEAV